MLFPAVKYSERRSQREVSCSKNTPIEDVGNVGKLICFRVRNGRCRLDRRCTTVGVTRAALGTKSY